MRYRRLNTNFVSTDPFTGLYLAAFGSHGPEILQLCREPDPVDVSAPRYAAALPLTALGIIPKRSGLCQEQKQSTMRPSFCMRDNTITHTPK